MMKASCNLITLVIAIASSSPAISFQPAHRGIPSTSCASSSCICGERKSNSVTLNTTNNDNVQSNSARETTLTTTTTSTPYKRRERYSGRYPRNFQEKYKERAGDEATIQKVLAKGMTPAGTHVPIMVKECLHYMGLDGGYLSDGMYQDEDKKYSPLLVVDCTLGYGGHSSYILSNLRRRNDDSRLIAFDQDSVEIEKTEKRLRHALGTNSLPGLHGDDDSMINNNDNGDIFTTVNQNFETLGSYLESTNQTRKVTNLLADLGLSSMQIDDNERGFTYKREGPLDMRMNPDKHTQSAYDLLKRLRVRKLKSMLKENSDEEFAHEIAVGLIGNGSKIPETTVELADRVRDIVGPLIMANQSGKMNSKQQAEIKTKLNSTVARVMQAIRIEVNGEFQVLEKLLEDIPNILAPGGKAVFLTFHSGEDRRVKKSFKNGFKTGIYSSWSDNVVRPSKEERRNNPRSSCCKLRWAIRSEDS